MKKTVSKKIGINSPHVYPEGCYFTTQDSIKDKNITIMGLGLNGGGEESVRFFLQHGAKVTVTDMKTAKELETTLRSLQNDRSLDFNRLHLVLGCHNEEDFINADCVIKTPGVRFEGNKYLSKAKAIETDISVFLHFCKSPIIAVTGSKGKSTCASLIYYGLKKAGFDCYLGGNITKSPLSFLSSTDGLTPVVLELSSWQLRDLRGRKALKPKVAVLTKIVKDHQNWYKSMAEYISDKLLLLSDMDENDYAVLPCGEVAAGKEGLPRGFSDWGDFFLSNTHAKILRYSADLLDSNMYGAYLEKDGTGIVRLPSELLSKQAKLKEIKEEKILDTMLVPGLHNRINALAAATSMQVMKVAPEQTLELFSKWTGIPHRLELFYKWRCHTKINSHSYNVLFYNDSASTVPEAAACATQAFGKSVIFICGGTDKNLDFTPLCYVMKGTPPLPKSEEEKALEIEDENEEEKKEDKKEKEEKNLKPTTPIYDHIPPSSIYLLSGTGTDKLIKLLNENAIQYYGPYHSLESLLCALKENLISRQYSKSGMQFVVFSPGATSFGLFQNEFERGDKFKSIVEALFT